VPVLATAVLATAVLATAVLATACSAAPASAPPRHHSSTASTPAQPSAAAGPALPQPKCTTAIQRGRKLPASDVAMTTVPAFPFGVAAAPGGWSFVVLNSQLGVFRTAGSGPVRLVRKLALPVPDDTGAALSPDGRYLLVADGDLGAVVISVRAAETGAKHAVLGVLSAPSTAGSGAIEVAVAPGDGYAFLSLEYGPAPRAGESLSNLNLHGSIAVFNLRKALTSGFGSADYVGSIPGQLAVVGLAISPDGRWLYSTSEGEQQSSQVGSLSVIDIAKAETDPAASIVARTAAGCNPVRVITSANGAVVWVTARASDALLAFSASGLRTDPAHALLADVRVGELPVGLALVRDGTMVVVADSDRFNVSGQAASLAVVSVPDALAHKPALLGYLPAGMFPREMALEPGGRTLLVTNYQSGQLEAVNIAALP
jgi:DNA-binding beta-propeller fold protein YncE